MEEELAIKKDGQTYLAEQNFLSQIGKKSISPGNKKRKLLKLPFLEMDWK
jgi:hypothetical protein